MVKRIRAHISLSNEHVYECDIEKLVDEIIDETNDYDELIHSDEYPECNYSTNRLLAERTLMMSYFAFMFTVLPPKERNFHTIIDIIRMSTDVDGEDKCNNIIEYIFHGMEYWLNNTVPIATDLVSDESILEDYYNEFRKCPPDDAQKRLGRFSIEKYKEYKKLCVNVYSKDIFDSFYSRIVCYCISNCCMKINTGYHSRRVSKHIVHKSRQD